MKKLNASGSHARYWIKIKVHEQDSVNASNFKVSRALNSRLSRRVWVRTMLLFRVSSGFSLERKFPCSRKSPKKRASSQAIS